MATLTRVLINLPQTEVVLPETAEIQRPDPPAVLASSSNELSSQADTTDQTFLILWKCLNESWHDGHIKERKGEW